MPWSKRASRGIPNIGSRTQTYEINDYSLGYNSFLSNDKFPVKNGGTNIWRLAQNARIYTLGEYGSRKGTDFNSDAQGETKDQEITSTTGAGDQDFSQVAWLAEKFTAGTTGRLSKLEVNIKNPDGTTGTPIIELWSNNSGEPGAMLARSSISASELTSSYQYLTFRFVSAPAVTATTTYWIVAHIQPAGLGSYNWSSNTSTTTALTSADSGTTWVSSAFSLNFKQYYATAAQVKGIHRAYKSDGTKVTLQINGTTLNKVDEVTGALTAVKTGLNSSASTYRFVTVNDTVYYVNGYDGLRKWDFTTESQVSTTDYSHITEHKGMLFLVTKDDPNKVVFSNFGDYETFTSTDFIYVPSPKTGDPVASMISLNGYLIIRTVNSCYILSGSDNATYQLEQAPDKKGTYTQETTTSDGNYTYYLANDGVYRSNGSEAQIMSADIYQDIVNLPNKELACMVVNRGRLYLWYTPSGTDSNSKCYVFSLNFGDDGGTTESFDTETYVNRAISCFRDDDKLLVGSSRLGQTMWQESDSNDYTNMGGDIDFLLQTHYMIGSSPAVLKEIRYWEPRFNTQSSDYTISAEYATDRRDNWTVYSTPTVQGAGSTYGSGETYGGGSTYGKEAEVQSKLYVPGEFRRIAVRYKHYATRQPNTFLGHTFVIQTRRLR